MRRSRRVLATMGWALTLVATPTIGKDAPQVSHGVAAFGALDDAFTLDGPWRFALASTPAQVAALADFYLPAADLSHFVQTPVPSNWAVQGFEDPHYKPFKGDASEGFYRRDFTPPAGWAGKRTVLHFGGVWSSAEVWVNGRPIGRIDSGFTEISFDVTSAIKPGVNNVVAVRVRQVQPSYLFDTNDDWALGGIYRSVWLEAMPSKRWIDRVETQTHFDDQYRDADLQVRVMVSSHEKREYPGNLDYAGPETYQLRVSLADRDGKTVRQQLFTLPAHPETGRETIATLHVEKPLQWTAETPDLYHLTVELLDDGMVSHQRSLAVGFREISTRGGVLRVNGQAVKLRGVDRHDEHPETGRATTPAQWRQDIAMMKAANINYIRLAHYPPASGFLDLCDQLGLYVSDEVPMGSGGDSMDNPVLAGAAMLRSYETVARDINHPSVIIWSIGNEDPLTSLHLAAIRTVKGLDPTRPVLMPWRAETTLPPEIDILAPHYFSAQQYDRLASRSTRPIVTTEYTHAYGTDGFGGLDSRWKALTRHPSGAGGAIWMWADQGIMVTKHNPDGSSERTLRVIPDGFDGITDSYRQPTRDYWETQAVYAPVYTDIDKVTVVPGQQSVRIPIQNDYDFTDLAAVRVAWKLLQDDTVLDTGSATPDGPPHARSWLDLPLTSLKSWNSSATTYLQLTFAHADGSVITRRAVELQSPNAATPVKTASGALFVEQATGHFRVRAGSATFNFDPGSGALISAQSGDRVQLLGLHPTLWRPLNSTEMGIVRGEKTLQELPDLNRYTPQVREWQVHQDAASVTVHAVVDYHVDASNTFTATYDYQINAAAELYLHYVIAPHVQARWLPYVGLDVQVPSETDHLRWLGLGPQDAFPNEHAAPVLGVWPASLTRQGGTKAMRWVETGDASNKGLRIDSDGYLSLDPATPDHIRILSSLLGRPEKGRRPEDPADRLDTDHGQVFAGQLHLTVTR